MFNYIMKNKTLTNEPLIINEEVLAFLHKENELDKKECRTVTASSDRGENYYTRPDGKEDRFNFYKEVLYRDPKTDGFIMGYPYGTVIRQGERNHYYRGETQIFSASRANLYRKVCSLSDVDRVLYEFVADMRVYEFALLLQKFEIVESWNKSYGNVLYCPLAQHYGLETRFLDITNDFDTALFFATCCWDNQLNWWRPLTKKEIEKNEATGYGVIFHSPAWQINSMNMVWPYNKNKPFIGPIGFQPFMRCQYQYGYILYINDPFYTLQSDSHFEKLHFKQSEKLSEHIFELMDCGKKIYPQEGITELSDIIKNIANATTFSQEAFEAIYSENKERVGEYFENIDEFLNGLQNSKLFGETLKIGLSHPWQLSRQRKRAIDRAYADFSLEKMGIKLHSRLVLCQK
ncbi:MAG: FRG domain-containing protein [Clostridia bacterium]|nr:FRG domain-containing protein [Clostridia bacterium]